MAFVRVIERGSAVLRFAAYALAACLMAPVSAAAADVCENRPLPFDADQTGELNASDCPTTPFRNSVSEIWTFDATIGERIVVAMNRVTMSDPYLIIVDAAGFWVAVGDDVAGDRDARAEFNVLKTGTYRAIATSFARDPLTDYGTYAIRLSRMTTPTAPILWSVIVVGNQVTLTWSPSLSYSPVLGYTLEVGSSSGMTDIGVFWVGPTMQVVAAAGPGTYFVRVRGHNASGAGTPSVEKMVLVYGEVPSAPRNFSAAVHGRRVTLAWSAPDFGAVDGYEIVVGSTPAASDLGVFFVGALTNVTTGDIAPGIYYARVRGLNAQGRGPESNEIVVIVF